MACCESIVKVGWNRVEAPSPQSEGVCCLKEVVNVTQDDTGTTRWALGRR